MRSLIRMVWVVMQVFAGVFRLNPGAMLLGVSVILFPVAARADVVADAGAPASQQPTVLQAGNGVPLVNIRTPSAAGVSRNTYSEFNVDQQGVILNNGRTDSQTQLGGWVQANPWLATGSARVILNEVNSSDPSRLNGYVEVAGSRAQVVIANPAGISCDGCGYINASRATLSTGAPIVNNGQLEGYNVTGGQVQISGAGLDNSTGYTDLIGQAVAVNAGIWTQRLNVAGGGGTVNAEVSAVNSNGSSAPAVAIDVSQLGGMYAGSIHLIGTQAGVGVRNAGQIGLGAGEVTLTADGRIENTGVVNGGNTRLDANTLDNSGSGRIYSDQMSVGVATLNNTGNGDSAPVIAARQQLDIGATTLNNREHGLLFSGGDMAIGGALDENGNASGQADTLNNASASIEAQGDLDLLVRQINNSNEHLQTEEVTLSTEHIVEYSGDGAANRYDRSEVGWHTQDRAIYLVTPDGTVWHNWNRYTYTRTVTETQVVNSDPGRIVAGGDLRIDGDIVNNDNSHVLAGGQLDLGQTRLNNITAPADTITTDIGVVRYHTRGRYCADRVAGSCVDRDYDTNQRDAGYRPAAQVVGFDLGTTLANGNAAVNTSTPDSALYTVNPSAPNGYLIETDPQFANYRQWISSDYMLQQLAVDPALTQMRLGDGFYEQQQVREQMALLTGRRFMNGFADDEAQYIALMDAGVTYAQEHNIRPGIALTAEQMAQLTSDIVLLVEEQRTLPDGTSANVLVPRLYVMVRENGITGNGGLVAADTLRIDMLGDFNNGGTLAGHQILAITADNINNVRGTLHGADVQLNAHTDVNTIGGSIRALDNLAIQAGNDINVASTTRTASNQQGSRTHIDRVAGLYVNSGSLLANAGNNINLTGAAIVNDTLVLDADRLGNTALTAGNDFILNSVQESETQRIVWADGAYQQSTRTQQIGSQIQTRGDVALSAGNDLTATAARINSEQGNVHIDAARDIAISAGTHEWHADTRSAHHQGREDRIQLALATVTAGGGATINAGRDLSLTGTDMAAHEDVALSARGDAVVSAVVDTVYRFDKESYKGDMGQSLKFTDETLSSTVVGGTVASGGDLLINARKTDDGRIIGSQSGDVTLTGTQLQSGGDIAISADGDVNITAIQYNTLDFHQSQKSGTGGLSKKDEGSVNVETRLHNALLASGGDTHLFSGNNLSLIAADVAANGNINLEAVDQLLIAAGQILTRSEQWQNESSAFSGGNLYEMREHRAGETVSGAQASTLMAGGTVTARAGTGRVVGSDIHGNQGVDLQADAGDVIVEAAQITRSSFVYDKEITVGLGEAAIKGAINPALLVQSKDGRATVHIADAHYAESETHNTSTQMRGSTISSGGDVNIAASVGNVNVIGSTLAADTDGDGNGDVNLSAAQNVNIVEATDTASTQSRTTTGDAELSLVVQNQAVEVVKAYQNLEDAKEQLEESKRQYKDYERNLDQLENSLRQLEQELADNKPGVNYDDIVELRALVEDVKDDKEWYMAGIALAALNLTSATTALMQQTATAAASTATWGFNAGLQLDIDATKTTSEHQSTTAVASTLSGQNIRINTGNDNTQNTTTNIQGSHLLASNNIAITTGDLNITASKNTAQSGTQTEHGHVTAQMTVYGAAGGASVNASFDRSKNSAKETTYNNSFLLADSIDITTSGDTTLRGATVHAESQLNADIQGNLIVESVQDRSNSRNTSAGISGGMSLGGTGANKDTVQGTDDIGALSGINAGANSANGMSNTRQTVLTSLTSGGSANINVQNHTQITGALIGTTDDTGNDLNQMNFSTGTLNFTDLRDSNVSSQTSAGLSSNVGFGAAKPDPAQPTTAQTSNGNELKPGTSNLTYTNSQQNSASNTLATLGHGDISVGGTVLEQNGELTEAGLAADSVLTSLNRDTTNTTKELWNSDYSQEVDVTVDHRLLTEDGRNQIKQNAQDSYEFGEDIARATNTILAEADLNVTKLWTTLTNNVIGTQIKNELTRNPQYAELLTALQSEDGDVFAQAFKELGFIAQSKFGLTPDQFGDIFLYDGNATTSTSLGNTLFADTKGGTVIDSSHAEYGNIAVNAAGGVKTDLINTLGHETIEVVTLRTGGANDAAQEAQARAFGVQLADRINQASGGTLDSTGGSAFSINLQNSYAVTQGTIRANKVGGAQVDNRALMSSRGEAAMQNLRAQGVDINPAEIKTRMLMGVQESTTAGSLAVELAAAGQCKTGNDCRQMAVQFIHETHGGSVLNDLGGGLLVPSTTDLPVVAREVALQFLGDNFRELLTQNAELDSQFTQQLSNPVHGVVDLREFYAIAFTYSLNKEAAKAGLIPQDYAQTTGEVIGAGAWNTLNLAGRWELAGELNKCAACPQDMPQAHNRLTELVEIGAELALLRGVAAIGNAAEASIKNHASWVDNTKPNFQPNAANIVDDEMIGIPQVPRTVTNGDFGGKTPSGSDGRIAARSPTAVDDEAAGWSQYDQFRLPDGGWDWPKINGAVPGTQQTVLLQEGFVFDRYGPTSGRFISPVDTPYAERALAPGSMADGYVQYKVLKPFPVEQAKIAPAFGEPGGGTQFMILPLPSNPRVNLQYLIDNDYIEVLP